MYLYLYFTYNVNLSTRSWWWVSSWQSSWCSWPPFFSFSAGERQYHSEKLSPSQPTLTPSSPSSPSSPWPSSRRKLCPPCPCPQTPDKPVKQNNHELAAEKVLQMKLCSYSLPPKYKCNITNLKRWETRRRSAVKKAGKMVRTTLASLHLYF